MTFENVSQTSMFIEACDRFMENLNSNRNNKTGNGSPGNGNSFPKIQSTNLSDISKAAIAKKLNTNKEPLNNISDAEKRKSRFAYTANQIEYLKAH